MAPEGTHYGAAGMLFPACNQVIQRSMPEGPWPFRLAFFIRLSY